VRQTTAGQPDLRRTRGLSSGCSTAWNNFAEFNRFKRRIAQDLALFIAAIDLFFATGLDECGNLPHSWNTIVVTALRRLCE
jgi:hypothetical protein